MKLELYPLGQLGVERVAVAFLRTVVGELGQIVGLEFYAVELVVASELLDFRLGVFLAQNDIAVLVAGEFVEQLFFGNSLTVFLFRAETCGYLEVGHDGPVVNSVALDFRRYLGGVGKRFGNVGEKFVHLRRGLEPFLLGVAHAVRIEEVAVGADADEAVV